MKKIRRPDLRCEKFARNCETFGISNLMAILDVETKRNSTYKMLKKAINLKQPLLMISTNEEFNEYHLSPTQFTQFEIYKNFLEVFLRCYCYDVITVRCYAVTGSSLL